MKRQKQTNKKPFHFLEILNVSSLFPFVHEKPRKFIKKSPKTLPRDSKRINYEDRKGRHQLV
jgi:hypothetical protein